MLKKKEFFAKRSRFLPMLEPLIDEPKYQLDDIINGDSDENALQDLKKLVRLIHMNQKDQF